MVIPYNNYRILTMDVHYTITNIKKPDGEQKGLVTLLHGLGEEACFGKHAFVAGDVEKTSEPFIVPAQGTG